jgi:hypothetical protein
MLLFSMFFFAVTSVPASHIRNADRDSDLPASILGTSPPEIFTGNVSGTTKELVAASIYVFDADNDSVHIDWEWGDGTPNGTSDVTGTDAFPEVIGYHIWNGSIPGLGEVWVDFTMNITATDIDNNAATVSVIVGIWVPYNNYPFVALSSPLASVDPGQPVDIVANATDAEGEPLTWTFVFNNSVDEYDVWVYHTNWSEPNATVWNNITATFAEPGNYSIRMFVSDALPGAQVGIHNNSVKSSTIRVALNRLPYTSGGFSTTPTTLEINSTIGELNVTFSIEVLDQDGDVLNLTWDFGDGSAPAYNETTGGKDTFKLSQWRIYNQTGQVNISVVLTDGRPGHDVHVYGLFNITSSNLPPFARVGFKYASEAFALPNETIQFTLTVSDPEMDRIQVIIDFGDNSTVEYYNLTAYESGNATLVFNHSYASRGSYVIVIWYSDNILGFGEHQQYYNLTVDVNVPTIVPKKVWSWWDYTSLAVFSMIPVLIVVNLIRVQRKRKAVEDEGMTLEEWKVRKSEMMRQPLEETKKGG